MTTHPTPRYIETLDGIIDHALCSFMEPHVAVDYMTSVIKGCRTRLAAAEEMAKALDDIISRPIALGEPSKVEVAKAALAIWTAANP